MVAHGWGARLIRSWSEGWMELPQSIGDRLGSSLLGAAPGQVTIADSTTVCFYKLASAAVAARPGRAEIVTDLDNFPTDRYVLEGLARQHGLTIRWIEADQDAGPDPDQVAAVTGPDTALVSFTHVAYRSAFVLDMPEITRVAHDAGALMLWDLSHSAGALPVALDASDVDLAVGCTYKYLNGGPGAPAFLYVRTRHQRSLQQPIWGWLGRREPFEMSHGYEPAPGITAMLSGTPPVLALSAVSAGVELVIEAGIAPIREKAIALTEFAIALADEWLAPLGVRVGTPRDPARRGAHIALVHPAARELCEGLIHDGVIVDFRTPDALRIGLSPLSTSFTDVWDGLWRLRELIASGHLADCASRSTGRALALAQKLNVADLRISSPAFGDHEHIPERHTGDGEDVAPALQWSGVPEGTRAFAVVVHDPDAPLVDGFTHWVAYGIPADATGLPEGGGDVVQGQNSFGNTGYGGPAPPPGHGPHHYYFWVYALDDDLDLEPGLDRRTLLARIEDSVIEQARLIGTYEH